jgi:hypothetical protein
MLEGAKATTETVEALRFGASTMKAMQKSTYIYSTTYVLKDCDFVLDILFYILFACYYMLALKPEKDYYHIFRYEKCLSCM